MHVQRILVALNLTDLDTAALQLAGLFSRVCAAQRVHFVHVSQELDLPQSLLDNIPELALPPGDELEGMMRHAVETHFQGPEVLEARYDLAVGSAVDELLRRITLHRADVVILGSNADKPDAGHIPEKVARKAPCSVLIVPQHSKPAINRILVALDYSDHSSRALTSAIALGRQLGGVEVLCVHAFSIPPVYLQIGKTYEQFTEMMKDRAQEQFSTFLQNFDLHGLSVKPVFCTDERPSLAIVKTMQSLKPDLVVMGARGRTDAAAVLLGSTTERVIRRTRVPLLAVKQAGEGLSLLEALLSE